MVLFALVIEYNKSKIFYSKAHNGSNSELDFLEIGASYQEWFTLEGKSLLGQLRDILSVETMYEVHGDTDFPKQS